MEMQMAIWVSDPRVVKDGDLYSAYCDGLELASSGITEKEAVRNLQNAIISYCKSLAQIGILEKRLEEKGIQYQVISTGDTPQRGLHPVLVT